MCREGCSRCGNTAGKSRVLTRKRLLTGLLKVLPRLPISKGKSEALLSWTLFCFALAHGQCQELPMEPHTRIHRLKKRRAGMSRLAPLPSQLRSFSGALRGQPSSTAESL